MYITYFSGVDIQLGNLSAFTLNTPSNKNSFILEPPSILPYCWIKGFVFICQGSVSFSSVKYQHSTNKSVTSVKLSIVGKFNKLKHRAELYQVW